MNFYSYVLCGTILDKTNQMSAQYLNEIVLQSNQIKKPTLLAKKKNMKRLEARLEVDKNLDRQQK